MKRTALALAPILAWMAATSKLWRRYSSLACSHRPVSCRVMPSARITSDRDETYSLGAGANIGVDGGDIQIVAQVLLIGVQPPPGELPRHAQRPDHFRSG